MEASARKKKRPLAAIPENLEELSKPELIKIIQSLQQQVAKKHKGDEVDAKALQAMRKRLRDKVVKAVKKTAHNDRKKPYSEISDGCASRAVAVALMNGLHPKSDTARMTRWILTGNDVSRFLGIERLVHPVKFDGKVWSFGGAPVHVYAWAAFESLEIKYENASKVLTLKSRTFLAGSGRPEAQPRLVAYSRGEAGGLIGRQLEEAQIQEMMAARPGC
jgi:hypothetical protein